MDVKKEIRVLGIDDAPFIKGKSKEVLVIGVVFRGGEFLDGVLSTYIECDGNDATQKIIEMVNRSTHRLQLRVMMTDGIAFGGFNLIDIQEIFEQTKIPVIVVMRYYPDVERMKHALMKFSDFQERVDKLLKAGEIHEFQVKQGKIYYQFHGTTRQMVERVLQTTLKRGLVPEPLRVAHLITTGIVFGESRGRA
ncbi:MAG: DUF99 family protein [Candidatus Nanoarchaeia archaeon]|nr:DUF99 family protein [Candidatus Haiyanarchaeum thermophilum]MCW1303165.1 DUF99 family protein [Candidatus Haiyanarchaeum thermophilum]MCW1303830.1 DUF99 family protein [Candidatus Haiyanarchaeum thermophilum]MCW1306553.1 DUF99 family protein [Candidatus Haiyanarchaeum thermophilum]MCW1306967.1 DUF99 family protein [Candidatus Haiyanarchaeum thermophilum]